jgi:phosphopantetheinyl transferase
MRGVCAQLRSWSPGPPLAHVSAGASAIDVWSIDLTAVAEGVENLLSADERSRAARILPEPNRTLWARSRGVLRALLGRYLACDPRELRFALGPHGKPALDREGEKIDDGEDLRFNLSHSGGLALVAVTAGLEVGIDIERARPRYTAEFLHDWVVQEAVFKCRGDNSTIDPWTAELDVGTGFTAAIAVEAGERQLHCRDWPA